MVRQIRKQAIKAMFSDDDLMNLLILKGGSAIDLVLNVTQRSSVDVDLSIAGDIPFDIETLARKVERTLVDTYSLIHLHAFDVSVKSVPPNLTDDFQDFWGGYRIEFKVVDVDTAREMDYDLDEIRKRCISIGGKGRIRIDISKHEYCPKKDTIDFENYQISLYPPVLIIAEKFRAICQQTDQYREVTKIHPRARFRDFFDIKTLADHFQVDTNSDEFASLVHSAFEAKRVPVQIVKALSAYREFHRSDYASVKDTVAPNTALGPYDDYFDYVNNIAQNLKTLWDI